LFVSRKSISPTKKVKEKNMKNLRKLGSVVVLIFVLSLSVIGGQIPTPPCAPPEPGQIPTPPCAAAPGDIDTPGVTSTSSGDVVTPTAADGETSFTEIAADLFLSFLPLF
jgi:hypothetical protein